MPLDWIADGVALGAIEDAMDIDALWDAGIRSVLSVSTFPTLVRTPFAWHKIPLRDGPGNRCSDIRAAVLAVGRLHRQRPAVLVHCAEGKSRSALVVSLYLATCSELAFDEAYRQVAERRHQVAIDDALVRLGRHLSEGPCGKSCQ